MNISKELDLAIKIAETKTTDGAYGKYNTYMTEEEWAAFRGEKKQFVEITLEEKVNYKKLSFTDHVALNRETGGGWAVDLDGDGTPENLYINTDGVFVNGKSAFGICRGKPLVQGVVVVLFKLGSQRFVCRHVR